MILNHKRDLIIWFKNHCGNLLSHKSFNIYILSIVVVLLVALRARAGLHAARQISDQMKWIKSFKIQFYSVVVWVHRWHLLHRFFIGNNTQPIDCTTPFDCTCNLMHWNGRYHGNKFGHNRCQETIVWHYENCTVYLIRLPRDCCWFVICYAKTPPHIVYTCVLTTQRTFHRNLIKAYEGASKASWKWLTFDVGKGKYILLSHRASYSATQKTKRLIDLI